MIEFLNDSFESISSKEWIVTNGIGGYASSSLCGSNTRRYHGLLVAAFNPPTDRRVLVAGMEEKITASGKDFFISSHQYPGTVFPNGFIYLKSFGRDPFPASVYSAAEFSITKIIFMIYGSNTSVIEYQNNGEQAFHLELTPLLVYRDHHHLFRESREFEFKTVSNGVDDVKIYPSENLDCLHIFYPNGEFIPHPDWYRNFEYEREKERGLDFTEDAKSIGTIRFKLLPSQTIHLIFTTDDGLPEGTPETWKAQEEMRIYDLGKSFQNGFLKDLVISGDQFLVWRLSSKSHTIIAGYHWFTDWGRDTMIAMRSLVIASGKKQIAESIFRTFISYVQEGLIPNRFPDSGEEPEYNTIDASLWLFVTLFEYYQQFEDLPFIESIFPTLTSIIDHHLNGTKFNIHVTGEGLLSGGSKGTQLTWMDAKVGEHVVTPRQGCAVEINALWYNALNIYILFGSAINHDVSYLKKKEIQAKNSFRKYFINAEGYLNDLVIPGEYTDESIRPNQVYALSLPFSPLEPGEKQSVLKVITDHLYTDLGLRTLSKDHADFKPVYKGDQWERDHGYHQGTVWAFLWGEYAIAYLKVNNYSGAAKEFIKERSKVLQHHFYNEEGIHCISEIFDGENPRKGKGCIQQAWSVAMTLRALLEAEKGSKG